MKRLRSSSVPKTSIKAATAKDTVFYKITEKQLKDYYDDVENIAFRYLVATQGFAAFDVEKMYGSYLDPNNDTLYLCVTDGDYIQVGEDDTVDPESAFDEFSVNELASYIQDITPEVIDRYISAYELKPVDVDDLGAGLIEDGYGFLMSLEAMKDLDLLDDIL